MVSRACGNPVYCKTLIFGRYFYLALLGVKYSFRFSYTISNNGQYCGYVSMEEKFQSSARNYE